ncbi:YHYH domain-containing protein [Rhizobium indicum]
MTSIFVHSRNVYHPLDKRVSTVENNSTSGRVSASLEGMETQPMTFAKIALAAAVFAFSPISASGHGGGLDKNGCHTDHKTGDYHCH